jgi:predicted DNA-binding transcriptional regulator AlpA
MSELQIMTNPKNPRGQLLNLRETAKRIAMSESHLRRLLLDGKGPPALKLPGTNRWHFWSFEVDAWVESGRVRSA